MLHWGSVLGSSTPWQGCCRPGRCALKAPQCRHNGTHAQSAGLCAMYQHPAGKASSEGLHMPAAEYMRTGWHSSLGNAALQARRCQPAPRR